LESARAKAVRVAWLDAEHLQLSKQPVWVRALHWDWSTRVTASVFPFHALRRKSITASDPPDDRPPWNIAGFFESFQLELPETTSQRFRELPVHDYLLEPLKFWPEDSGRHWIIFPLEPTDSHDDTVTLIEGRGIGFLVYLRFEGNSAVIVHRVLRWIS
jgi:hypothetical protein